MKKEINSLEEYIAERERIQGKPSAKWRGMQREQWAFEFKQMQAKQERAE